MTTWILVADACRAKLFAAVERDDDWALLKEFDHPEGREFSKTISPSSPYGRVQQSVGVGHRSVSMTPHTSPKESEFLIFARELSNFLEDGVSKRKYNDLVVVAPPHFLGLLHGALGSQTEKHLRVTVDKGLTKISDRELRERLLDIVFVVPERLFKTKSSD